MATTQARDRSLFPNPVPPDDSTTLLGFLTEENPPLRSFPPISSKDNTKSGAWRNQYPALLKPWDDFTVSTFKAIYTGQLFEACIKNIAPNPEVNTLDEATPKVSGEAAYRAVFREWNWKRVNWALNHPFIKGRFNPALWRGRGLPVSHQTDWGNTPPAECVRTSERNMLRPSTSYSEVGRKSVMLYPDDGAGRTYEGSEVELVTMDYKVAAKWNSEEMLDKYFCEGRLKSADLMGASLVRPIKQLFAYCVSHGCLNHLQTEARATIADEVTGQSKNRENLKKEVVENGLMEYISVPWTSHRDNEDKQDVEDWTVNLALFFILILAGNKHECDWNYGSLRDEELRRRANTSPRLDPAEGSKEAETFEPQKAPEKVTLQSLFVDPEQPEPVVEDPENTTTVKPDLPLTPVLRRSTRLKNTARSIPPGVAGECRGHQPTRKRHRSQFGLKAVDASASNKRSKQSQDDYLISFTGSVDGFNKAQEALQGNDTEALGYARDRSSSEDHNSEA